MQRSKTNTGLLSFFEKVVRSHPLIYYIVRSLIRYTQIFEEDANGVQDTLEVSLLKLEGLEQLCTRVRSQDLHPRNTSLLPTNDP